MATGEKEKVTLGAGKWYVAPHESGAIDISTIAVEENIIGWTQGGAEITYTPEIYTIEDDIGMVRKVFQTKAEAEMKTGLLTFNMASIHAIMSVGEKEEIEDKIVLKLTGGKSSLRKFAVVFVYEDDETGLQTRVGMIASNTSPLKFVFAKDKETVVDAVFTATSNGVDDTLVVIEEDKVAA